MKTALLLTVGLLLSVSACNKSADAKPSDDTKLHPQKEYCVWYEHSGQMMSGTSQMCSRKHGRESFTITNTSVGMMGVTQKQSQHSIIKGNKIINIDLDAKTYTVADNPIYDEMSETDAKQLGEQMMAALNMTDTGQDKMIAGTTCNVLTSQFGLGCYTDSMIMMEQEVMGNKQIATKVDLSYGGPDTGYNRHKQGDLTETQAVDINDLLKRMGQ